jgi:hypothetical protein
MARALSVALAVALPCALQAQSPGDKQGICRIVARTVLAIDPAGGWRGPWQSPVRALTKASGGIVSIDAEGWRGDKEKALDKLRQEYRAAPSLLAAIGDLTDDRWSFALHRFGESPLGLAEVIEGSASCQRFVFFAAPANEAAHSIVAPLVVRDAEPFAFCYRTAGYAGEVSGVPAFVVEDDQDSAVELSFTPWRQGDWQPECRVHVRFSEVFEVIERFCGQVDCRAMADHALSLIRKVDARPEDARQAADVAGDGYKAMKDLATSQPRDVQSLPTFGGSIQGHGNVEFAADAVLLPVVVGGETYLARVGHVAVGWRTSPDYLFAAYKRNGGRLEPVAGLYVSKTRGKPLSATVD